MLIIIRRPATNPIVQRIFRHFLHFTPADGKEKQQHLYQRENRNWFRMRATCLPGLECILADELDSLGVRMLDVIPCKGKKNDGARLNLRNGNRGGIEFLASAKQILQCHHFLGTASRILLRCQVTMYDAQKKRDRQQGGELHEHLSSSPTKGKSTSCNYSFRATVLAELRRKVSKMNVWLELSYLLKGDDSGAGPFPSPKIVIKAKSKKSRLFHTGAIAQRVEQGIVDALQTSGVMKKETSGLFTSLNFAENLRTESIEGRRKRKQLVVNIYVDVQYDIFHISLDIGTSPLHKRGYRLESTKAPLREDIAYALLRSVNLLEDSHLDAMNERFPVKAVGAKEPTSSFRNEASILLVDPFCGSGTIAIEGASILSHLAPGRLRRGPVLAGTKLLRASFSGAVVERNSEQKCNGSAARRRKFRVLAGDRDAGAIRAAKENARRAGVADVEFHCCSASELLNQMCTIASSYDRVIVVTNPPYGKRLSAAKIKSKKFAGKARVVDVPPLLPIYQTLGKYVSRVDNARIVLLAHDVRLARRTGLRGLKVNFITNHGGIPVTALTLDT